MHTFTFAVYAGLPLEEVAAGDDLCTLAVPLRFQERRKI